MNHSAEGKPISELMSRHIVHVSPEETLFQCTILMEEKRISSLLVVEENGLPAGILTEKDILRTFNRGLPPDAPVSDLMSRTLVTTREMTDYRDAYHLLARHGIRHLVVVDEAGRAAGIVSETDFRQKGGMEGFVGLRDVASVMNGSVPMLSPSARIKDVAMLMESHKASCVLVTDGLRPIGIVTERDMVRLYRLGAGDTPVDEVMSKPVLTVSPGEAVIHAVQRMQSGRIRHLVVVNGEGETLGIISEHDVVKHTEGHYVELLNQVIGEQAKALHQNQERIRELTLKAALAESEKRFKDILEYAPIGMSILAPDGRFMEVNQALCRIVGYEKDALERMNFRDITFPKDLDPLLSEMQKLLEGTSLSFKMEKRYLHRDGHAIWARVTATLMRDGEGKPLYFISQIEDINDWKQAEEKLRLAASIYLTSSEAMMVTDDLNRIVDVNPAFTQITGYDRDEVVGKDPDLLKSDRHDEHHFDRMWQTLRETGHWEGEIWNLRKNGELYAEWLSINAILDENGRVRRYVSQFTDITEKKRVSELIWRQANYDCLTELPNRRLFLDRLDHEIRKSRRSGNSFALLFADLDRFKEVNDLFGHHFGDRLLTEAAKRIVSCIRESDTVARFGSDEFIVMLPELKDAGHVGKVAQSIIEALGRPHREGETIAFPSASIGISIYPHDARTADNLLSHADQALFAAKSGGRGRFSYFTKSMQDASRLRLQLGHDLHGAIQAGQFLLNFQPIADIGTGAIFKCEALLRWRHPVHGMVSPAEFVPIAERIGLIDEIGDWVFKESAKFAKCCSELLGRPFRISVNVSPVQFMSRNYQDGWIGHLERIGLSGKNILIEITEGVLLNDRPEVEEMLIKFRDAGLEVVIDDFGTGYSSLAYLKKFHIDFLKIDQAFTRNLTNDSSSLAISEAIIVMAHKLGIQVIAEGVETSEQRKLLALAGCDFGQGLLYSEPLPQEAFLALLTLQKSDTRNSLQENCNK